MKNKYSFLMVVLMLISSNNVVFAQKTDWIAPVSSNNLKNPLKGNVKATAEGKKIYEEMCVLCHGLKGKGNGEAGLTLERKPANFLSLKVQNETDGNIFWKITNGKSPMATYDELLREDQRWKLVNYIRELGKKTNTKKK